MADFLSGDVMSCESGQVEARAMFLVGVVALFFGAVFFFGGSDLLVVFADSSLVEPINVMYSDANGEIRKDTGLRYYQEATLGLGFEYGTVPDVNYILDVNGDVRFLNDVNIVGSLYGADIAGSVSWAELGNVIPWADANVADDITVSSGGSVDWTALGNYPSGCAADEAVRVIGDTLTCVSLSGSGVSWSELNAVVPWADVNVSDDITVNGYVTDSVFNSAFPVDYDVNVTNRPDIPTDTTIDSNVWAIVNGQVPWQDVNVADDITLTNITQISNRAFSDITGRNFSLLTLDDNSDLDYGYLDTADADLTLPTVSGENNNCLKTDGASLTWGSCATGGGGATYTSGTPATLDVDNDANTLSLNFDGNFYSRLNSHVPWADVNVSDDITVNGYVTDSVFNSAFPVDYDANLANAPEVPTDATIDANIWAILEGQVPWQDVNVADDLTINTSTVITGTGGADFGAGGSEVSVGKSTRNITISGGDATIETANGNLNITAGGTNRIAVSATNGLQPSSDGGTELGTSSRRWNGLHVVNDANVDGNVSFGGVEFAFPKTDGGASTCLQTDGLGNLSFGSCGGSGSVTYSEFRQFFDGNLAVEVPWQDVNVADDITLTNITQISNRAFSDITGRNFSLLTLDNNGNLDYGYLDTADADLSLPTVSGQNGKYLTTDGSTLSWGSIASITDTNIYTAGVLDADSNRFTIDLNVSTNADGSAGFSVDADTNRTMSPSNGTGRCDDVNADTITVGWC